MNDQVFSHFHINPIQALHRLKEAGFTEKQAEVQIEIATECFNHVEANLATKRDLKELEVSLKRDMKEMEVSLRRDMKEMDLKFESKFRELEMRLTIKMGAITSAVVGFFYILEKFF